MTTDEIIDGLIAYNKWRRGGEGEQPCPRKVGLMIDLAASTLAHYQKFVKAYEATLSSKRKTQSDGGTK